MSKPIKQTLFQFKSFRAPQLISEEVKSKYFIMHYNGTSGDFFTAVANMGPTDVKKDVLQTAAQNFADKKTTE